MIDDSGDSGRYVPFAARAGTTFGLRVTLQAQPFPPPRAQECQQQASKPPPP